MNCKNVQKELVGYLYGELDSRLERQLREHLDCCSDCTKVLADMATVKNLLGHEAHLMWPHAGKRFAVWYAVARAAALLIAIGIGWFAHAMMVRPPATPSPLTEKPVTDERIVSLLAQNLRYRTSFASSQFLLIQEMEKTLAEQAGMASVVAEIHRIDSLQQSGQWEDAVVRQQEFVRAFPASPLAVPVCARLAANLTRLGQYQEACRHYRFLLNQTSLAPLERGEYLWQLAMCYQKCGQVPIYRTLLEELEQEDVYGVYRWKAVKTLADEDFAGFRFTVAMGRYRQYVASGTESSEVAERLVWMEFHLADQFYPLTIFLQARQQEQPSYYGLRQILADYPDSPLAQPSFEVCVTSREIASRFGENWRFPGFKKGGAVMPYLTQLAGLEEYEEVSCFARYQLAAAYEAKGEWKLAFEQYTNLSQIRELPRLAAIARQRLIHVQENMQKQF
jgi:tetratricopeptide (TPR) repeat protein